MKAQNFILPILFFVGFNVFGQTKTVTGIITDVQPYFADQYALTIGENTMILLHDVRDTNKNSFEINKPYKDLLILSGDKYVLNPKYAGKTFKITYTINGKGWKCIQSVKPFKK